MPVDERPAVPRSHHDVPVAAPYRLDLTVSVLRRLSTNVVDVFTPDGQYARALGGSHQQVVAPIDIGDILDVLRPQQGMLYYHLLLARLEARGDLGRASMTRS